MRHSSLENIRVLPFSGLTLLELHEVLKIRVDVFVVEQQCAYPEIDGLDPRCLHAVATDMRGRVIGTARIAPAGVIYSEWSIGRVAVSEGHRGKGLGRNIMEATIDYCMTLPAGSIKIAAQTYLEKFYTGLGFNVIGEPYLWDGIAHVDMRLILPVAG